jgi:amino acid transporter
VGFFASPLNDRTMSEPSPGGAIPARGEAPPRYLSTFDAIAVIVGVVIGSGIFEATPRIAAASGNAVVFLGVWTVGALVALAGALCFAELGTRFPEEGGVYAFLRRGLGRRVAVYYGLCDLLAIHPATIGMMAFIHARFAVVWAPLPGVTDNDLAIRIHAAIAIVVFAALNFFNFRGGSLTQNVLSVAKVVGLSLAFLAGCLAAFRSPAEIAPSAVEPAAVDSSWERIGMAFLFVLFAYGGWNDLAFVAGEIENPRKKLRRALVGGVLTVASIYLLLNASFVAALGIDGIARSNNVVADVAGPTFGSWGTKGVAMLVSLCALGAVNGCIFTGSRVYIALGQDVPSLAFLKRWSGGTPRVALVVQALTALAMIAVLRSESGFDTLLTFSMPFFWTFMALVGIVYFLVILRYAPGWLLIVMAIVRLHGAVIRLLGSGVDTGKQVPAPWGALFGVVYLGSTLYLVYCSFEYAWGQPRMTVGDWSLSIFAITAGLAMVLAVAAVLLADRRPLPSEASRGREFPESDGSSAARSVR